MFKNSIVFLFFLAFFSCRAMNTGEKENKILFSLNTSSCMGPCPVYELLLNSDSTISFNGLANTQLKGENLLKLDSLQFLHVNAIINNIDWKNLKSRYDSDMLDLPSKSFMYNMQNDSVNVYQYGLEPKSLVDLSNNLLDFVYKIAEVKR